MTTSVITYSLVQEDKRWKVYSTVKTGDRTFRNLVGDADTKERALVIWDKAQRATSRTK